MWLMQITLINIEVDELIQINCHKSNNDIYYNVLIITMEVFAFKNATIVFVLAVL